MMDDATIAAVATPGGHGGVGIVKISGSRALEIATAIFIPDGKAANHNRVEKPTTLDRSLPQFQSHQLRYGHIIDPKTRQIVDEVLVSYMKAPRSYTREDVVEINAHGGPVALNAILELVCSFGARIAEPGEFTRRAFINGRIDLTQAEAVIDIINARTEKSLRVATAQVDGRLRKSVEAVQAYLVELAAHTEAAIDFPDDVDGIADPQKVAADVASRVIAPLKSMIRQHTEGRVLREGLKTVVVGRPNVGKSSLLNCLVQKERAIVTEVPGTTRDMIEETLNIDGYPVVVTDTAGVHTTDDLIESLGIEKTLENINSADLILFIVEANCPVGADDHSIFELIRAKPVIVVINKIDLINGNDLCQLPFGWQELASVKISALYGKGIDELKHLISKTAFGNAPFDLETSIVPNLRQKALMEDSLKAAGDICREINNGTPMELVSIHLQDAIGTLGQILGTNVKVDLLDQIFSRFCIGK